MLADGGLTLEDDGREVGDKDGDAETHEQQLHGEAAPAEVVGVVL